MTSTAAKKASGYSPSRHGSQQQQSASVSCFQMVLLVFVFVWVLAVMKIFVLEKYVTPPSVQYGRVGVRTQGHDIKINSGLPSNDYQGKYHIKSQS